MVLPVRQDMPYGVLSCTPSQSLCADTKSSIEVLGSSLTDPFIPSHVHSNMCTGSALPATQGCWGHPQVPSTR